MKVLAIVLLCAFATVQGRSAGAHQDNRALANLGEQPWFVHLRVATDNSGYLKSCAGSLIGSSWTSWVLTSAECIENVRFIWYRYGVTQVIHPALVTEGNANRRHPAGRVSLLQVNRIVQSTPEISPVALYDSSVPASTNFCAFGDNGADGPGEFLSCFDVTLEEREDVIVAQSEDSAATSFDLGAPLMVDGVQIGVLIRAGDGDNAGTFATTADLTSWIEEETGLVLTPEAPEETLRV